MNRVGFLEKRLQFVSNDCVKFQHHDVVPIEQSVK